MKFYPRAWAKYSDAKPGTLRLIPPAYRLDALEFDYIAMKDMLYGDILPFKSVIGVISDLEREINAL